MTKANPMERELETTIVVNGTPVTRRIPARRHLIDFLREEVELTGSHTACEHGACGAAPCVSTGTSCQASLVEVDVETGFVKLLKHWCVEDCGTVINPMLVNEQIRGGIVQGIGPALFEECHYGADGQLLNGNMADYLVPMAAEMPDIVIDHVVTPTETSELGAKGVGEAGTGAPGAVMNAINDALLPLGARVTQQPATPERILEALRVI